jgi:hypothetical protein
LSVLVNLAGSTLTKEIKMNGMQSHEWRGPHPLHDRIAELEKQVAVARRFIFEWDSAGSSGAWPYATLKELREVLK